jgi:hypothetical protein
MIRHMPPAPSPTPPEVTVYAYAYGNNVARCTSGFYGKNRALRARAVQDAWDHTGTKGHLPTSPLVVTR